MSASDQDTIFNIKELLEPILAEYRLELYDMVFKGTGRKGMLRVYIDREEGVTIDDCANVSRELGTLLDVHDVIEGSYTLEVSSPGLTRELRNPFDFMRYKGKKVKIKTEVAIQDRNVFIGKLLEYEDDCARVETESGTYVIPYSHIEKANLELDL
jgi:ribosome maturation factor RimP